MKVTYLTSILGIAVGSLLLAGCDTLSPKDKTASSRWDHPDIIDAANEYSEAEYIILEQDYTRLPSQIDGIKKSMEGFKKLTGIEWS